MSNTSDYKPSQSTQPSGSLAPITGEGPITQDVVDAVPIRTASQIFNILNGVHDYQFRSFFDPGAPSFVFAAITECFENGVGFMGPAGLAIYSTTPIEEERFPDGRFVGHVLLKINNTWGDHATMPSFNPVVCIWRRRLGRRASRVTPHVHDIREAPDRGAELGLPVPLGEPVMG